MWVSVAGSLAIISAKICATPVATSSFDDRPEVNTETYFYEYMFNYI